MSYERVLAVDDIVLHVLQNGIFDIGRIPVQNTLGVHRSKPKCHDRVDEDLAGDPLYKNIMVKMFPNDGDATDLDPKNLVILDRNLTVGQLVKKENKVGYVVDINQIASARIYDPDPLMRNNPSHEMYIYNQPASVFRDNEHARYSLEKGDRVILDNWIGLVKSISRNVFLEIDFNNGTKQNGHILQMDLLLSMMESRLTTIMTHTHAISHFDINGLNGIFEGRKFQMPYKYLINRKRKNYSFRWSGPDVAIPLNEMQSVGVTVTQVNLHMINVDWEMYIPTTRHPHKQKPNTNIKNEANREKFKDVIKNKPLKVGDIRECNMTSKCTAASAVMGKYSWRSCVARDFFLHRRRNKRPKLEESTKEMIPDKFPGTVVVEIVLTKTTADILWIDGTSEDNVDSRDVQPVRYKKYFPGAIFCSPEYNRAFSELKQIGQGFNQRIVYSVVQNSKIFITNYKDKTSWNVQDFEINQGGTEPHPLGEIRRIMSYTDPVPQIRFWKNNEPQVVVKMKGSLAAFNYGKVVAMLQDGHIKIRDENDNIITVWPTDIVPVNPIDAPNRSIFEGIKFNVHVP